jgi:hypothetical protein
MVFHGFGYYNGIIGSFGMILAIIMALFDDFGYYNAWE